jgi:hypothetical protein
VIGWTRENVPDCTAGICLFTNDGNGLLLKRRLDGGKRTSRVERKELEKKKLAEVPPTALQNNLVMMAAKRAREIQDAEDAL